MKRPRFLALPLALTGLLMVPGFTHAQIPVTDGAHILVTTEAEIARYLQAAYDIYQRGQQIYNQVQQINYQIQALRKQEFHSWRDVAPLFFQLDALLREAETVTAATHDLEEVFYATFPGSRRYLSYSDETYTQVQRALNTYRVSFLALQQIHQDTQGSLGILGVLQDQVERAEGHQEALEALGELSSWQANQLSTIAQTLGTIATTQIIASSHSINEKAQSRSTQTDALTTSVYRAAAAAGSAHESHSPFPAWMPHP